MRIRSRHCAANDRSVGVNRRLVDGHAKLEPMAMRLGALEFTRVFPHWPSSSVLTDTVRLGADLERWGYSRIWLAEHHTKDVAHASPEVLMAAMAASTSTISVGSAGVLLRLHNPLRVARAFLLLEGLFPGRVDLGCARAGPGAVPISTEPDDAYDQVADELLRGLVHESDSCVTPGGIPSPRVWLMGSGSSSARMAGRLGLRYCHAAFLASADWSATVSEYRASFIPSRFGEAAYVGIAAGGVCAETDSIAETSLAGYGPGPKATVVGGPDTCRELVLEMCQLVHADEFLFLEMSNSARAKRDSYERIADLLLK